MPSDPDRLTPNRNPRRDAFDPHRLGPRQRTWRRFVAGSGALILAVVIGSAVFVIGKISRMTTGLPSVASLESYLPPTVSRIYASDDRILAELAAERRLYTPFNAIPDRVKKAFIAAEDKNFYAHHGVDLKAILRAEFGNITRPKGRRPVGASTITQQVARNMILNSRAPTLERKEREALLAMRIERVLSKQKILEIYLNGIYLGQGAYGVAAAAQTYFNKPLDELTDAEAAYLASLPKSPSNYDPYKHADRAVSRRNWVLTRMVETGALSAEDAAAAQSSPLIAKDTKRFGPMPNGEWFASEVRRQLIDDYGETRALEGGLEVHTSLDPRLQDAATHILHEGLMEYDRRRSRWRGPVGHVNLTAFRQNDPELIQKLTPPAGILPQWRLAVMTDARRGVVAWRDQYRPDASKKATIAQILPKDFAWMKSGDPRLGEGDLVMIEPIRNSSFVAIRQIPEVQGALISLDAHTGRVLAMVGGWSFKQSQFNRVTQALRQPGSSFKPFVYLDAMENGVPPSEKFDDAPISFGTWHPMNYEKDNWGPTTLHDALRESRNLVTIRLAAYLGMNSVAKMAQDVGLVDKMPHVLPAALGAVETTVLKEAGAYASLAAGGKRVTPHLIDTVLDRDGSVLYRAADATLETAQQAADPQKTPSGKSDQTGHQDETSDADAQNVSVPHIVSTQPQIASPESAYQVTSMLQDAIRRGTGRRAAADIDREIAGKTGTSQDFRDAWFAGFAPDIVTVVWVGYDTPRSLGRNETGGRVAGPIWNRFMKFALEGRPKLQFRVPDGITLARYDTGRLIAVDGFKADEAPGASIALHGYGAGTEPLNASDTGADVATSEDDMMPSGETEATAPPAEALPPPSSPSGVETAPTTQSQSDIGLGGLY
ncbi:penicillin-binding protein 1A [Candidatus Kirkpatrickella diaphorinae]|uniref:penicillin-binding protein 1A n=1 Tax=Candidatus Kirkpatrickella diaphorinae TaxID=2984322 RepID=UPI0029D413AC|nr:PBP1A family penicillin-binding protein [Candidatus Kirkpatrickella diaphorinae]